MNISYAKITIGGIRCVKINAYLEQKLSFTNVSRLQGGIISYTKELEKINEVNSNNVIEINDSSSLNEEVLELIDPIGKNRDINGYLNDVNPVAQSQPHLNRNVEGSKFRGVNYVFDERMGARITADILSLCETCGAKCDLFTNCENYHCHVSLHTMTNTLLDSTHFLHTIQCQYHYTFLS